MRKNPTDRDPPSGADASRLGLGEPRQVQMAVGAHRAQRIADRPRLTRTVAPLDDSRSLPSLGPAQYMTVEDALGELRDASLRASNFPGPKVRLPPVWSKVHAMEERRLELARQRGRADLAAAMQGRRTRLDAQAERRRR